MSQYDLVELLQNDIEFTSQLEKLLQQEKAALASDDSTSIEALANRKLSLLQEIDLNEKKRAVLLRIHGVENSRQAIEDYIGQTNQPLKQQLKPLWERLQTNLHACKRQNEVNGAIVTTTMQNTRQVLNILLSGNVQNELYGSKGELKSQQNSSGHTQA